MAPSQDHLANARKFIAIAESGDAKREAYKLAADEIAAHIDETGDSQASVARDLQVTPKTVGKLLAWRRASYPGATTPFTMADSAGALPTDRAAASHARKMLREAPIEQVNRIIDELDDERIEVISDALGKRNYKRLEREEEERRARRARRSAEDQARLAHLEELNEHERRLSEITASYSALRQDLNEARRLIRRVAEEAAQIVGTEWPQLDPESHEGLVRGAGKTRDAADLLAEVLAGQERDWDAAWAEQEGAS